MSPDEHLEALEREGQAFTAALDDLTAPVTACPGWSVADLAYHTGEVHRFWSTVVRERLRQVDEGTVVLPARPDDEDLPAWFRDGVIELLATLQDTPPDTPVWTWAPQQDAAFVRRRMAQETTVHRWDAERAAGGRPSPIDPALAVDGIDELCDFFLGQRAADDTAPPTGSLHLHATDTEGEWVVRADGTTMTVVREHAKGDAAVRGPASDLLLALWRRADLDQLEVLGDRTVAEELIAFTDLG